MDRLNEYAPLLNEFVNKNNLQVLTVNNVVKTIANVVRNYLLGNVPCSCKDDEISTCTKKLMRFRQYPFFTTNREKTVLCKRTPRTQHNTPIVKQVLRHALYKLKKDPTNCCKLARSVKEEA